MAEFGLVRPFGIDNGELDRLSRSLIFVLGYELALFDERLKLPADFEMLIHAQNFDRVNDSMMKSQRQYSLKWMAGDSSETWLTLTVAGCEPKREVT